MSDTTLTLQEQRERSAIVVLLPDLGPVIQDIRRQATQDGPAVPPHVTLFSPFFAPNEIIDDVLSRISRVVTTLPAFSFVVERIDRFPAGVWYMVLTPAEPFRAMIDALRDEFAEVSPYWDRFTEVIPHVTIADEAMINAEAISTFVESISHALPVPLYVDTVTFIQRRRPSPAPWDTVETFPLRLAD